VAIDEERRVPAGEHGLMRLLAGEAGGVCHAGIARRTSLQSDDLLFARAEHGEVAGNASRLGNRRRVRAPVTAIDHRAVQEFVRQDGDLGGAGRRAMWRCSVPSRSRGTTAFEATPHSADVAELMWPHWESGRTGPSPPFNGCPAGSACRSVGARLICVSGRSR
jgi:hypothetical protein